MSIAKNRFEFYETVLLSRQRELIEKRRNRPILRAVPTNEGKGGNNLDQLSLGLLTEKTDSDDYCELAEIEKALNRLKTQEYGCCRNCNNDIQESRLQLLPATTLCFCCAKLLSSDYIDEKRKIEDRNALVEVFETLSREVEDEQGY